MRAQSLQSCPTLCNLWTVAGQAPLSMGFSRKNTGVGCCALLQWILPTQELNPYLLCLLHCRQVLYSLSYLGSPCSALHAPKSGWLKPHFRLCPPFPKSFIHLAHQTEPLGGGGGVHGCWGLIILPHSLQHYFSLMLKTNKLFTLAGSSHHHL